MKVVVGVHAVVVIMEAAVVAVEVAVAVLMEALEQSRIKEADHAKNGSKAFQAQKRTQTIDQEDKH